MKAKIIGIVICIMLMTTFLTVAKNDQPLDIKYKPNETEVVSFDDDVPIWEISDIWTYRIDDIIIDFEEENQTIHINLQIDSLSLEVIDDTGDSYKLSINAEVSGTCDAYFDFGDGPVNITARLESTPVSGDISFVKSNLGMEELNVYMEGHLQVNVLEQPYIDLPFSIPEIPVPGIISLNVDFENPFAILDFPLNTTKIWNLSSTNFSVDGEIKSIWLNILNFVNKIASIFGVELLPPELAELLPIFDIGDALNALDVGNVFEIPAIPYAFACFNRSNVTVEAGTYDAYNITIVGGLASVYYAPEAGNIIRISGKLEELLPYIKDISMELIETNYV